MDRFFMGIPLCVGLPGAYAAGPARSRVPAAHGARTGILLVDHRQKRPEPMRSGIPNSGDASSARIVASWVMSRGGTVLDALPSTIVGDRCTSSSVRQHLCLPGRGRVGPGGAAKRASDRRSTARGVRDTHGGDARRDERRRPGHHPGRPQDHRGGHLHLGQPGRHLRRQERRPRPQADLRVDSVTGEIDRAFHPVLSGRRTPSTATGRSIYVGGSFTAVNGNGRYRRLVQLTTAGRIVAGFRALPNNQVNEVVVRGSRVFVGGHFTRITTPRGAITRHSLAAVQARTGAVLASVTSRSPVSTTPGKPTPAGPTSRAWTSVRAARGWSRSGTSRWWVASRDRRLPSSAPPAGRHG